MTTFISGMTHLVTKITYSASTRIFRIKYSLYLKVVFRPEEKHPKSIGLI
jgi:hypothetical protein